MRGKVARLTSTPRGGGFFHLLSLLKTRWKPRLQFKHQSPTPLNLCLSLLIGGYLFFSFAQQIRFRDVAREIGINVPGGLGACCAFADYNNDGFLDVCFNPGGRIYLFKNNSGLYFTDMTDSAGLSGYDFRCLVWGDYDNNGFLDILATDYGNTVYLFKNNGDGTFNDVAAQVGLATEGERPVFLDYNRDGLLDVLIIGFPNSLLFRQTDTTFRLVYTFAEGKAGTCFDYNNDFNLDIYICRDGENKLYRNNGDSTWTDVTSEAGVGNIGYTEGAVAGDFNNDGNLDLYITNLGGGYNAFYVNQGNGTFINRTSFYGVGDAGDGRTCDMIDFNNDRLLDIFTTNHVVVNRLYKNLGYNVPFINVAGQVNIANPSDIFAASWGDYDNDGDLDAFLTGHDGGYALMRDSGGNYLHYLKVKLEGTRSNRAGIGCRIYLFINDTMQLVELSGGSGQDGHNPLIAHFGTGMNTTFDSLVILWTSGARSSIVSGNTDTLFTVIEPTVGIEDGSGLNRIDIGVINRIATFITDWQVAGSDQRLAVFDVQGRRIRKIDKTGIYFLVGDEIKKVVKIR